MKQFNIVLMSLLGLVAGCTADNTLMQSLEPTTKSFIDYTSTPPAIVFGDEHPIVRLAAYTLDQQGNPYPKVSRQRRFHDTLYLPYEVSIENIEVPKNNRVTLGDVVDSSRMHPEAIGVQLYISVNSLSTHTSLFFEDTAQAEWGALIIPSYLFDSNTQPIENIHIKAREIMAMPQGQTFSDITLPERATLEFSMAYLASMHWNDLQEHAPKEGIKAFVSSMSLKKEVDIPLIFKVTVLTDTSEDIVYSESIATQHPELLDKKKRLDYPNSRLESLCRTESNTTL